MKDSQFVLESEIDNGGDPVVIVRADQLAIYVGGKNALRGRLQTYRLDFGFSSNDS